MIGFIKSFFSNYSGINEICFMTDLQKYFLAILPPQSFTEEVRRLKLELCDAFGVKQGLRSPAHITLKMPFSYNAHKEEKLIRLLQGFGRDCSPINLELGGVGQFRDKVVYLAVQSENGLYEMQERLMAFCRQVLHLPLERSDLLYHPHLTIAFRDVKKTQLEGLIDRVSEAALSCRFETGQFCLLKRIDGKWEAIRPIIIQKEPFKRK